MITQEEQNREYLEQYNKARETPETMKDLTEQAKEYFPPYPDGIITNEITALREGFIKGCKVTAKQTQPEIKVDEKGKFIFNEVTQELTDSSGNSFKVPEWIESMNKKVEELEKKLGNAVRTSISEITYHEGRYIETAKQLQQAKKKVEELIKQIDEEEWATSFERAARKQANEQIKAYKEKYGEL